MNILSRPGWYIALSLFVTHQIVQYGLDRNIPLIDSYLDPLLCIPIILGVWLTEGSYLYGRPMRIGFFESCVVIIFLALLFEEGFPRWQPAFVRDWWDYLAYRFLTNDIYVPNADVLKNPLQNYTADGYIRSEFMVGVAYEDDIEGAKEVIQKVLDG